MNNRMVNTAEMYQYVNGLEPYKTPHNLSYQITSTGDMGILYPNYYQMCLPGDKVELDAEAVVRFNPQLAPLMHQITAKTMWFFVPYRLLWKGTTPYNSWETWITGAVEGTEIEKWNKDNPDEQVTYPDINEVKWNPLEFYDTDGKLVEDKKCSEIGTVWESIGLPYQANIKATSAGIIPKENLPIDFVKRAYNKVWNDWFRDENLQKPRSLKADELERINWRRDYLTSAGYDQQKGISPGIPVQGSMPIKLMGGSSTTALEPFHQQPLIAGFDLTASDPKAVNLTGPVIGAQATTTTPGSGFMYATTQGAGQDLTGIGVTDLRLLIAIQRALELDMRAGTRYTEYLQANFNTRPEDARLQLAEYIGLKETDIITQEVLQTSETTSNSALGEMGGHAIGYQTAGQRKRYYCQEHGVIIGLFTVVPKPQYQQKMSRDMMINIKEEFYRPQYAYLSEQAIYNREVSYTGLASDNDIWGYQGNFDHLRIRENLVMGLMRSDVNQNLSYWNLARYFDMTDKDVVNLNGEFIRCLPRKDWLIVPSQPALIYTIGWHCYAERPIPATSEPGLLDHVYGEGGHGNKMSRTGRHIA